MSTKIIKVHKDTVSLSPYLIRFYFFFLWQKINDNKRNLLKWFKVSNNVPKISCVYMRNISWNQVNRKVHSHGLTDVHFCPFLSVFLVSDRQTYLQSLILSLAVCVRSPRMSSIVDLLSSVMVSKLSGFQFLIWMAPRLNDSITWFLK